MAKMNEVEAARMNVIELQSRLANLRAEYAETGRRVDETYAEFLAAVDALAALAKKGPTT